MRPSLALLVITAVTGCGGRPPAAVLANAEEQPIAADSLARVRLAELTAVVPGLLLDLRYATPDNFTSAPLPGYGVPRAFLRQEAAAALARVQLRLRARGLGLKVWDAYRPVRATLAMVAWCERTGRTSLLDEGYIARRSRHNQGVAIDLTVVDLKRQETITNKWIASRVGWTPYDGMSITGWPVGTFVRGKKVVWDGALVTPGQGESVRFSERQLQPPVN